MSTLFSILGDARGKLLSIPLNSPSKDCTSTVSPWDINVTRLFHFKTMSSPAVLPSYAAKDALTSTDQQFCYLIYSQLFAMI